MWELDHKEGWELKNWCFHIVVLEKNVESPLDCQETKSVHLKGHQPWLIIGRIDAEPETPILWPSDVKSQLIRKDHDAGKDWRQEEKGMTEDEMIQWHHWLKMSLSKLQVMVKDREACHVALHGVSKSWTRLRDWTRPTFQINHKWIYAYLCHVTFFQKSLLSRITTAVWLVSSLALQPLSKCLLFVDIYHVY